MVETSEIILETGQIRAAINVKTLQVTVLDKDAGFTWSTPSAGPHDLGYRIGSVSHEVSFADPIPRRVQRTGERSYRVLFPELNCFAGFALTPGREDELIVTVGEADGQGRAVPMASSYPRNFVTPASADAYTVVPLGMGMLIPGDYGGTVRTTYDSDCLEDHETRIKKYADIFRDGKPTYWWDLHELIDMDIAKFYGAPKLNMFGAKAGRSAYLALVPQRFDWHLGAEHDPGQPTRLRHFWVPSMQRLRYDRVVHYRFCPGAGYVELAKQYRGWLADNGNIKTLAEKVRELPHLDDCRGGLECRITFMRHNFQKKIYKVLQTFEQGQALVEDFRKRTGFTKVNVSARAWQKWGHDFHYPSLLPPNIDCGGAPGFQKLARAVRAMGYHFELDGDNYHDIAFDSPDFSEAVLMRRPDGSCNRYNMWASGMTSKLALPWAFKFLRRNFELGKMDYPQTLGLLELVPFDYYWIGNWGGNGSEDYNPACSMDRTEHHKWVACILSYIRGQGKVLDMEHSSEWCVQYLDRCNMRPPQMLKPNEDAGGGNQGIPLPLWHLVFHDATVIWNHQIPWTQEFCLGGFPKISLPLPEDFEASGKLERLRIQTRLNEKIGFDELVSHEYLDAERTRERCAYACGVVVEVDHRNQTYRVQGHPEFDGQTKPVPGQKPKA